MLLTAAPMMSEATVTATGDLMLSAAHSAAVAATAALWAGLNIKSPIAVTVASLVMGAAVSSMHYTGMFAVSVDVTPAGAVLPGATAMQFIFPLAVGLGSYLFLTSAFVALSPTTGERAASASAQGSVESVAG